MCITFFSSNITSFVLSRLRSFLRSIARLFVRSFASLFGLSVGWLFDRLFISLPTCSYFSHCNKDREHSTLKVCHFYPSPHFRTTT